MGLVHGEEISLCGEIDVVERSICKEINAVERIALAMNKVKAKARRPVVKHFCSTEHRFFY